MGDNLLPQSPEQLNDIAKPHDHDVLSGRGNFVNHHAGNENFRKLVKHHKKAYVACPKSQKAIYSKIIYDEIRAMNPPGRFLKQDPKTKLWCDIGEKKALDKTRQALREGAPELLKELGTSGTPAGGSEGGEGTGGNNEYDGGDYVAPLRTQRNDHRLAESLLGNISLGSFSLGSSFVNGLGGDGNNMASFTSMGGVDDNFNNLYGTQGTNSILAAAAQIQAQQQQHQQHQHQQHQQQQHQQQQQVQVQQVQQALQQQQQQQQQQNPAEWEAQLQLLKAQMQINSQQANAQQQAQQQGRGGMGNGMGNNQNPGFNAMVAAAQSANGNNMPIGSNEMTTLLAAIHNSASGLNNAVGPMGNVVATNAAYQQQLAQLAMFNSMNGMNGNNSESTIFTGNLNNGIAQMSNNGRDNNGNTSVGDRQSFASISSQATQQHQNHQNQQHQNQQPQQEQVQSQQQQQQQKFQGGYQEQSFNVSLPLKCMSEESAVDTHKPMNNVRRPGNMRGSGGLNSSFTRAQRIGLKNSFTQRRPNRRTNNSDLELKNSLMSIESLTLEDIDGTTMEGVFDTNSEGTIMMGGNKVHGEGPHDMSEVSELEFEEKA
mmetsp:Transcript_2156/g.4612  ORF Transcript_2156/g.4612 Transcript_2156/m.4612 type:complete len:599 (+) Transcript_2156:200-1996(+)